jgi:hypothetical protein
MERCLLRSRLIENTPRVVLIMERCLLRSRLIENTPRVMLMMKRCLLSSVLLLTWHPIWAAENFSYVCTLDGNERKIEVVYLEKDKSVPCEVLYVKNSVSQTLWSARRQEGFCESKAESFVQKQSGWGWSCRRELERPSEATTDG